MKKQIQTPLLLVQLYKLDIKTQKLSQLSNKQLKLELFVQIPDSLIIFSDETSTIQHKYLITRDVEYARYCSNNRLLVNTEANLITANDNDSESTSICIQFTQDEQLNQFVSRLKEFKTGKQSSTFDQRTDESSSIQYFQFYAYLSQQQNMMQDYIRTSTYQRAIFENYADFQGKVVLDVGAGSGILSFFAAHAGASKVYAIEASSMAQHARQLIKENKMSDCIEIIAGKIEEIELPEQVDVIISEPMGYMLYNERMLESFLHAKKFLKPNGRMYPAQGDLYVVPFNDEALYMEQVSKANFWTQQNFYGIDLSSLKERAIEEYFKQPIVDTFDVRICLSKPIKHSVNFLNANESDLYNINIPLKFDVNAPVIVHGLAFWFDVVFMGSVSHIWLSTGPTQPLTHWYQVRCLLPQPFLVNRPSTLIGHAILKANKKQSYDVEISLTVDGANYVFSNILDLKNPFFRYTGQSISIPPGQYHESPTEQYFNTIQQQPQQQQTSSNGIENHQTTTNGAYINQQPHSIYAQQQQHPVNTANTGYNLITLTNKQQ